MSLNYGFLIFNYVDWFIKLARGTEIGWADVESCAFVCNGMDVGCCCLTYCIRYCNQDCSLICEK